MSARQNKKRKGRNHVNNRERTVTTFTEDPNTSFLVPLSSEEPPASLSSPFTAQTFSMPFQSYVAPVTQQQQQQFFPPVLPPGKNDLEILENLKSIIKEGQHEFYRAIPQPAALASLYMGHIPQAQAQPEQPQQDIRFDANGLDTTLNNTVEPHSPLSGADTSPVKLGAETLDTQLPEPENTPQGPPIDTNPDVTGEYGTVDAPSPDKSALPSDTTKDDDPNQPTNEDAWERHTLDDRKTRYDDPPPPSRATTVDSRPQNGTSTTATATDAHFTPTEDRRHDRDRDRDRDHWERDRDRHDSFRDFRDRNNIRDRDFRDRRPEFFGRSYGRSHAPRPPPELRHYEPSYGDDYVPPPRRFDPDDRRGGLRNPSLDERSKPSPFDDRRPPPDDRRPLPPPADDRRLTLDDRPIRRLPGSDTRALPPSSEDRTRPVADSMPLSRATAEDDRGARATSLVADDRPRANVPLEERLSQPAPMPSLQDRLSQPVPAVVPTRVDIASAPSLEERLSSGPVLPRTYTRSASVVRDDLRAPLSKDDLRDHDRINDFRTNRDFPRDRSGGPLPTTSTYRPDLDRNIGDRSDRDRRDRAVVDVDALPARYGDTFNRVGPPPTRRYSPPPPTYDRERERGRAYYPPRSPPPFRSEGVYDPDGDRRYATDRERDAYEQRRRDWYGSGDDDKRGPPPPQSASWRPHERPPFMDRDRERLDRERDRDRDLRERDRDRDLGGLVPPHPPPPPTRSHWDDRDRRVAFPLSSPPPRIDTAGGAGPGRSLSARLTDPYPPPSGDDRAYPPPRDFDRGRYGGPALDDHAHGHGHAPPQAFSRVRNRSPSPLRRGPGLAEDLRPPVKRMREDSGPGYSGVGLGGGGGGAAYSPPRRGVGVSVGGGGEYAPGPPASSSATTTTAGVSTMSGTVPARSVGARTPPLSAPPPPTNVTSGAFYEREPRDRERERDRDREREREREYVRGEYGMGYDRDDRGRRSPPMMGSRMSSGPGGGGGGGYGRGVIGDRRDDRRYVPPPPPRAS